MEPPAAVKMRDVEAFIAYYAGRPDHLRSPMLNDAESYLRALIAQRDALLEALKVVEWAWNAGPPKHQYCVCCGRWKQDGHNPVCRVALAITNAEGK